MRIPDDCTVRLMDMPWGVHGMISESPDGHSNIYINARDSRARQRRALDHELTHSINGDLDSQDSIRVIEARASRRTSRLSAIPQLMRARDLLPKPAAVKSARPAVALDLTPYQARVLASALSDLDRFVFGEE